MKEVVVFVQKQNKQVLVAPDPNDPERMEIPRGMALPGEDYQKAAKRIFESQTELELGVAIWIYEDDERVIFDSEFVSKPRRRNWTPKVEYVDPKDLISGPHSESNLSLFLMLGMNFQNSIEKVMKS